MECVTLDDFQMLWRCFAVLRHVGHQERDHSRIDFDRRDACTFSEELVREDADTWSDLEHVVTAGERRTVSDLLEDALIDQKMLAEIGIKADAVKV